MPLFATNLPAMVSELGKRKRNPFVDDTAAEERCEYENETIEECGLGTFAFVLVLFSMTFMNSSR